jgi:hypothetical protein
MAGRNPAQCRSPFAGIRERHLLSHSTRADAAFGRVHHNGREKFGRIDPVAAINGQPDLRLSASVRILSALEDLGIAGTSFDRAVLSQYSGVRIQELQEFRSCRMGEPRCLQKNGIQNSGVRIQEICRKKR